MIKKNFKGNNNNKKGAKNLQQQRKGVLLQRSKNFKLFQIYQKLQAKGQSTTSLKNQRKKTNQSRILHLAKKSLKNESEIKLFWTNKI